MTRELAAFEKFGEIPCTEAQMADALFGENPVLQATLAVDEDGAICAHALWRETFGTFSGRRGIWLEDLFVREPCRQQGHAKDLMAALCSKAEGRMAWEVLTWNERAV